MPNREPPILAGRPQSGRASSADHDAPAYVLWFGLTGLNVARALGRRGVRVTALHHDENEPCTRSRYARVRFLPALTRDPNAWLEFLLSEGRRIAPQRGVLFPASDAAWLFIAAHRSQLEPYFDFALPDVKELHKVPSKPWQYALAGEIGIAAPRTAYPSSEHDVAAVIAHGLEFPCLIKPALSHEWCAEFGSKLTIVHSAEAMMNVCRRAARADLAYMIQEIIPADDHDVFVLHAAMDRGQRPLALCVVRKVRQYPPYAGNSSLSVSVEDFEVMEQGLRMLTAMRFHGLAGVEFKRDKRDGTLKLMEVNVRPGQMMCISEEACGRMSYALYRELTGLDPGPLVLGRPSVRTGILECDYQSFRHYQRLGRESWLGWLKSWVQTREMHFAWDDPAPARGALRTFIDHWRRGKFRPDAVKHEPLAMPLRDEHVPVAASL